MVKVGVRKATLQCVLGALLLFGVACSSGAPEAVSGGAVATAAGESAAAGAMVTSVVSELVPQPRLVIGMTHDPIYTSYNPQPDVFVVDLPGATRANGLTVPKLLPEHVASVSVDDAIEGGRTLTRVTVRFREASKAHVELEGRTMSVVLGSPAASRVAAKPEMEPVTIVPEAQVVVEDLVESAPVAPPASFVAKSEPRPAAEVMTASIPKRRDPVGPPARTLSSVAVDSTDGVTIRLKTDGVVRYSDFQLPKPLRLVFDLNGVVNQSSRDLWSTSARGVSRVRVGQFQGNPDPITRLVLDLDEVVDYDVERLDDGLVIRIGRAAGRAAAVAENTTSPAARAESRPSEITEFRPVAAGEPKRAAVAVPDEIEGARHVVTAAPPQPAPRRNAVQQDVIQEPVPASSFSQRPRTTTLEIPQQQPQGRVISPTERIYEGEPITLTLKDADIKDVLRTFAQLTGLNIAIDPGVSGTVTVEFVDVPWDQAFELILRQNGLTFVREGNVVRVGSLDRLSAEQAKQRQLEEEERLNVPLQTVIKPLSYAEAGNVVALLKEMASPRGRIVVDERTNQLIISDIPAYMQTLLNLVETIDIPTPQVIIEARVVETTKNFSRNLGVQWGFNADLDPALGTGTGLIFPNRISAIGGPFDFGGGGNPILSLSLGNVLGTFDLDLVLSAAESEGLARVVSAPRVQTQDNQQADIESGVQIPLQTRVNFTTTVTYVNATLRLGVRPHITSDDTVIMKIEVQKIEPALGLLVAGAQNSPLLTRRASTTLMVPNGGTTVIGGIYQTSENRAQSRVPFLHEIPVIGNLFKDRRLDSRHDELLIFITPRIVR